MALNFREDVQRKLSGKNLPLPVRKGAHDRETPSILGQLAGVKRETMRIAMKLHDEADRL